MIFKRPLRLFTLFPRRFKSLFWDDNDCLRFSTWWQWGARCFRIRSRLLLRSHFSDWEELQGRVAMEDLDAMLIYTLLKEIGDRKLDHLEPAHAHYENMVTATRDKYQV